MLKLEQFLSGLPPQNTALLLAAFFRCQPWARETRQGGRVPGIPWSWPALGAAVSVSQTFRAGGHQPCDACREAEGQLPGAWLTLTREGLPACTAVCSPSGQTAQPLPQGYGEGWIRDTPDRTEEQTAIC